MNFLLFDSLTAEANSGVHFTGLGVGGLTLTLLYGTAVSVEVLESDDGHLWIHDFNITFLSHGAAVEDRVAFRELEFGDPW